MPLKFDKDAQRIYLDSLRAGNLKHESARMAGVSFDTVKRRRKADPDFAEAEQMAMEEAREGIEKVLYDMARQGDISAIKMWLTAHDRSTYGQKQTVEIDASTSALEMSRNDALAAAANLQRELQARRAELEAEVVDVEWTELPDTH